MAITQCIAVFMVLLLVLVNVGRLSEARELIQPTQVPTENMGKTNINNATAAAAAVVDRNDNIPASSNAPDAKTGALIVTSNPFHRSFKAPKRSVRSGKPRKHHRSRKEVFDERLLIDQLDYPSARTHPPTEPPRK